MLTLEHLLVSLLAEAISAVVHIACEMVQYVTDDLRHLVHEIHLQIRILGDVVLASRHRLFTHVGLECFLVGDGRRQGIFDFIGIWMLVWVALIELPLFSLERIVCQKVVKRGFIFLVSSQNKQLRLLRCVLRVLFHLFNI